MSSLRPLTLTPQISRWAEGSCLCCMGHTHVLCTASIHDRVPRFLRGQGSGWISAEYAMLPRSTSTRQDREATKGRQGGRTHEIQRLIGRALRGSMNLHDLGERHIKIDCDVLQADGGTRTAAINGGWVALAWALKKLHLPRPVGITAISCTWDHQQNLCLDPDFEKDSHASIDANFIYAENKGWQEVQCSGEGGTLSSEQLSHVLPTAHQGIQDIWLHQLHALTPIDSPTQISYTNSRPS